MQIVAGPYFHVSNIVLVRLCLTTCWSSSHVPSFRIHVDYYSEPGILHIVLFSIFESSYRQDFSDFFPFFFLVRNPKILFNTLHFFVWVWRDEFCLYFRWLLKFFLTFPWGFISERGTTSAICFDTQHADSWII